MEENISKRFSDKTVERAKEIREETKKGAGRRIPAMELYVSDFSLSVQDVAELLEIRPGTAIRWSTQDKWTEAREEVIENIKKDILETAQLEHSPLLKEAASNFVFSLVRSSESVPAATMKEVKALVDTLEKIYKIFGDLNMVEKQAEKHEHSLEVVNKADVLRVLMEEEENNEEE